MSAVSVWLWVVSAIWLLHALKRVWDAGFVPVLEALPAAPTSAPARVSVVVPARDEAARIGQTVRRLLAQRGVDLEVVVVDDRSTDGTSEALASLAAEHASDGRLRVVRVDSLPAGWLGKCHACHLGAREARGEWVLFTDADIWLADDSIARAVAVGEAEGVEHVCLVPGVRHSTLAGKTALLGFSLLWLPHAARVNRDRPRACVGVGAFNLIRAETYRAIGGHERLRMEVVDDLKLGLLVRASGGRTRGRIGGPDADADWGANVAQLLRDLEKNHFAVLGFRVWLVALAALAFAGVWGAAALGPAIGFAGRGGARWAGLAAFGALMTNAVPAAILARRMGWPRVAALGAPILMALLPIALMNSAARTLWRGGIRWRETFYPLRDLRAGLVTWERAADLAPGAARGAEAQRGVDR